MGTRIGGGVRGAAKRMGTSSESCKLQDEQYQYYKNLDDEKKYFLVLMLGDFQDAMFCYNCSQFLDGQTIQLVYKKFNMVFFGQLQIIPEEVVRRFKSEIPGEIKLETRNGYSHTIVVAKNQENLVLTVGWRQFVENYDLQMDDSLIFRYKGNSQFSVMIFDKLGREKALSVVPAPFLPQVQDRRNEAHEIGYSQKMDVPPERRKRRTEYHYANLDDEKKYFLVLMLVDFQHEMIVPKEFVQRFKGEFPREMILETQNRRSCKIGVAKNNGKLVFTVGWGKFVETFGLEMDDTILFRYNGNSQFNVIIFDEDGCEKASSVFLDPSPPPVQERCRSATDTVKSSHVHAQAIQTQSFSIVKGTPMGSPRFKMEMGKSCEDNNTVISISSCESSGESCSSEEEYVVHKVPRSDYVRKRKARQLKDANGVTTLSSFKKEQLKDHYITAHKTKLTSTQKEVVKQKVQSMYTEIPIFVAAMRKYNVAIDFLLTFPRYYAKKYLGEEPHMYLQRMGRKWDVWFSEKNDCKNLRRGWRQFVEDHKLKIGDICLFKLLSIQSRTMEVYIIRANDANYQAGLQNDGDREAAFQGGAPTHHAHGVKTEAVEEDVVAPDGA
uniref:Putative B3 domain-containing protein n=1 Tax=Aegilops tauschii TaxID=37682 RepID=M8CAQ1_AEGTA